MPVWHCGDPAGWNRYKDLVPWHQADRVGEIEELLEIPLMTKATKIYNYGSYLSLIFVNMLKVRPTLTPWQKYLNKRTNILFRIPPSTGIVRIPPKPPASSSDDSAPTRKAEHDRLHPARIIKQDRPKSTNTGKKHNKRNQLHFATHPTSLLQRLSYCPVVVQSEQTSYCTPRNRAGSSSLGAISAEDLLILLVECKLNKYCYQLKSERRILSSLAWLSRT